MVGVEQMQRYMTGFCGKHVYCIYVYEYVTEPIIYSNVQYCTVAFAPTCDRLGFYAEIQIIIGTVWRWRIKPSCR